MGSITDPELLVRQYYERVDSNDIPGLLALFDEAAEYRRPGYDVLIGREALRKFYEEKRVIATGRHGLDWIIAEKDRVAVAGHFSGRLHTGDPTAVEFADFFEIRDGAIVRRQTFFAVPAV